MLEINDLVMSKEMDKGAMSAVVGGNHSIGNYNRYHNSTWKLISSVTQNVQDINPNFNGNGMQIWKTYKRTQSRYIGRLVLKGIIRR